MITPEQKDRIEFILSKAPLSESLTQGIKHLVSNQKTPLTVSQGDAVIKKLEQLYPSVAAMYEEQKSLSGTEEVDEANEAPENVEEEPFTIESLMEGDSEQAGKIYLENWLESFETAFLAVQKQGTANPNSH